MTTPPTADTRDGAFLALALADALSLGLPDPDYITMHPHLAGGADSAVDFQFNNHRGRDPLPAMRAWADRFGAAIRAEDDDPSATWHEFDFTHAGVLFHAYAKIQAAAPEPDPAAVPAASGQPVITGDEAGLPRLEDGTSGRVSPVALAVQDMTTVRLDDDEDVPGVKVWTRKLSTGARTYRWVPAEALQDYLAEVGADPDREVIPDPHAAAPDGEPCLPASFLPLDRPTLAGGAA